MPLRRRSRSEPRVGGRVRGGSLPGVLQGSGGRGGRGGRGRGAPSCSAAIASTAALDVAAAPYRRLFEVSGRSRGPAQCSLDLPFITTVLCR